MLMRERPLFIDVSSHQTYLDLSKSTAGDVLGVIMRAEVGLNKDVDFVAFDNYYDWNKLYRGSYHALWPMYSVNTQFDKWMEVDPKGTLHMLDVEVHNNMAPKDVANAIVLESNLVLERTGKRPWMYGAYWFLTTNLIPFVTAEWLNEHWWVLAQYNDGDAIEDEVSIMLPDKIDIDRVVFQQTTGVAELYPGSGAVDRDRFLLGDEEDLKDFMDEWLGNGSNGSSDCCEELEEIILDLEQKVGAVASWWEIIESTNRQAFDNLSSIQKNSERLDNKATKTKLEELHNELNDAWVEWRATNTGMVDNILDIKELRLEAMSGISGNQDAIDSLQSLINTCSLGIAELSKRLATLQQGQLELAENGLGYEEKFKSLAKATDLLAEGLGEFGDLVNEQGVELTKNAEDLLAGLKEIKDTVLELYDKVEYNYNQQVLDANNLEDEINDCVDSGAFDVVVEMLGKRITELGDRIDGLEGGHNHPKWMRWLRLVK